MVRKIPNYHDEQNSPFKNLRSKPQLCSLLFISKGKLKRLSQGKKKYHSFSKRKKDGTFRAINAPQDDLKSVQSRIANLLQRIAPPDYLFSPVVGRSYVDNAFHHLGAKAVRLLDIENFFPSCTANKVIWFFQTRMGCSSDVAVIMKEIVTLNDSLPQGSPCSPILAYLTYIDMWEEINSIVDKANCKLSVYADDLTISGQHIPEEAIWDIKKALYRHGHRYNRKKEGSVINKPSEITGVILTPTGTRLPNRQHQKIYHVRQAIKSEKSDEGRIKLEVELQGRISQKEQVISPRF